MLTCDINVTEERDTVVDNFTSSYLLTEIYTEI